MFWLPLVAFAPVQAPEAVQPVAFAELQLRTEEAPLAIDVGLADSERVGDGDEGGGVGVGVGVGVPPSEVAELVVVTLPSQPATTIPIPIANEARARTRQFDVNVWNTHHSLKRMYSEFRVHHKFFFYIRLKLDEFE